MRPTSAPARRRPEARRGVAAVELAVVLGAILMPLMIGIWEMGRAIQVQQVVANAAREGARLAAQGRTVNQSGTATQITKEIAPGSNPSNLPNVRAVVFQSLVGAGLKNLTWNDVTVVTTYSPDKQPWQASKNEPFSVFVSINFDDKVRWVNLGIVNPTTISYTANWRTLVDDPFLVSTAVPAW